MFTRRYFSNICLFAALLLVVACNGNSDGNGGPTGPGNNPAEEDIPEPGITELVPQTVPVGGTLTINGRNFSPTASEDTVRIGGTMIPVDSASIDELRVTIPESMEYDSYVVYVTVNGKRTASPGPVDVVSNAPNISSLQPSTGAAGTEVTISGVNFSSVAANNTVMFGDTEVAVQNATKSELTVIVPEGLSAGDVPVTISVDGVSEQAASSFNFQLELVPISNDEGHTWTYNVRVDDYGNLDWTTASYDDSSWQTGEAGFGEGGYSDIRTDWTGNGNIYIRRTFTIDNLAELTSGEGELVLKVANDDDSWVYINGVEAASIGCCRGSHEDFSLSQESIDALQAGENIIAIRTAEYGGGQYIDAGLYFRK